jgi:hypothetical protein
MLSGNELPNLMKKIKSFSKKGFENAIKALNKHLEDLEINKAGNERSIYCVQICLKYIGGVMHTHTCEDIPKHDSGESLFFFKDKAGESVLIGSLRPRPGLMPEMKRISIKDAQKRKMKAGGKGFLIQRVYFQGERGGHSLMLICFDRFIFEKL